MRWKKIFYFERLSLRYQASQQVLQECWGLRMKTLERCQSRHSSVFIVNREHISRLVLMLNLNRKTFAGLILKWQIILKTRLGILRVMLQYFKCEQNLATNDIWIYTITTLRVNQWEIFEEFTSNDDSS